MRWRREERRERRDRKGKEKGERDGERRVGIKRKDRGEEIERREKIRERT